MQNARTLVVLLIFLLLITGTTSAQIDMLSASPQSINTTTSFSRGGAGTSATHVVTVCPTSAGDFTQVSFSANSLFAQDTLRIYDGSSTSSNLMDVIVFLGSTPRSFTAYNTGGCLTFELSSGAFGGGSWTATLDVTSTQPTDGFLAGAGSISVCGGGFYDDGGSTSSNFGNYVGGTVRSDTSVICPSVAGSYASLEFNEITLHSTEEMRIYDGDTDGNLLAVFAGDYPTFTPYTIDASLNNNAGGCLTVVFSNNGDGFVTRGWDASISCNVNPVNNVTIIEGEVETCGGKFIDTGGLSTTTSVYGQYASGQHVTTLCPSNTGEFVTLAFDNIVAFPGAYIDINVSSGEDDVLYIHDGNDTLAPVIAAFKGFYTSPISITAGNSTGCLTARFESSTSGSSHGWEADLSCSVTAGNNTILATTASITCSETGQGFQSITNSNNKTIANREEITTICNVGSEVNLDINTLDIGFNERFAIYDGKDTTAAILYEANGFTSINTTFTNTSTNTDGCLTVLFQTNGGNTDGFTGTLNCVGVPFPVELVRFEASINRQQHAHINWVTASERDNDYFLLEKSQDGQNFHSITRIYTKGNENFSQAYQFTDEQVEVGYNYYRLKQVDLNGEFTYSKIIQVFAKSTIAPIIYNIANTLYIKTQSASSSKAVVHIWTFDGKLLWEQVYENEKGENLWLIENLNINSHQPIIVKIDDGNQLHLCKYIIK